jgi:hypothetical protein
MVDMGSIAAALGGLKSAGEIAKAILQLKSDTERQAKIIELQSVILAAQSSAISAQSDQYAMLEEVRSLKEEVAKVKAWETQKQRYQMVQPYTGATVYALKKAMSEGEPPHYICANCYQAGKRSILQNGQDKNGWTVLLCPNLSCKSEARTGYRGGAPRKYAEEIGPQGE